MDAYDIKPWDQRDDETGKAYTAFTAYLACGFHRTLKATALKLGQPERYAVTLKGWCTKHDWVSRAAAHDQAALDVATDETRTQRLTIEAKRLRVQMLVQERALDEADEALAAIIQVARDVTAPPMARLRACELVLTHAGIFAPAPPPEIEDEDDGEESARTIEDLTPQERQVIVEAGERLRAVDAA